MAKHAPLQTNFSAGELSPELAARRDTKQYQNGAKSLLNNRIVIGGGARRRPGTRRLFVLDRETRIEDYTFNQNNEYVIGFSDASFNAWARGNVTGLLSAAGSLTGCPWTTTSHPTLDFAAFGNTILVTHPEFLHIVSRTGPSSWSQLSFPWYADANGRIHQPHYKTAAASTTLAPSALTGSITVTASASYFNATYAGKRLRILGREVNITAFTDTTHVTATVIEPLRPTQTLTVTASASFAVGEVIAGSTSSAKGEIAAIPDGTHITAVIIQGLTKFAVETIVGPNATTAASAVADATPAAVRDWTEQLYSAENGYPRCVEIHRGRILLAGSASAPNAIAGSSISNIFDFDVGLGSDADGFLETIGDAAAVQITQLHSAEQLLVLTDKGPYYVPETAQNPFRPTALAFNHFGGTWPCASARSGDFDSGALYVSGSIVIKMSPTGNSSSLWEATEKSFLCPALIKAPTDTFFVSNYNQGPERYAGFVNVDGTMAVAMLVDSEQIRNFVPWETTGVFTSACSLSGDIYAIVKRTIDGVGQVWLERFDDDLTLDGVTDFATVNSLIGVSNTYGSETVNIVVGGRTSLGTHPLAVEEPPDGPYQVGFNFQRVLQTLPPQIEGKDGNQLGEIMRIVYIDVDVLESARFAGNGYELEAYMVTEDPSAAPPLRTGPRRIKFLGWRMEPTITITQPDPLPLHVRGIKSMVAF